MAKEVNYDLGLSNKSIKSNDTWIKQELAECKFKDERLGKRFQKLFWCLWNGIGESIPFACQDWANTKAAYRFFSNNRIKEEEILSGHFQSTKDRFSETTGNILVLHDTTEFSYKRENPKQIGLTYLLPEKKNLFGKTKQFTACGILMHSSLVVTSNGLPLGLSAVKFWTRKEFKGSNELKKRINSTRVPIEKKESFRWLENLKQSTALLSDPNRCVHIGDRESDIYELFCEAKKAGTHFLVRTCADRLTGDGNHTISDKINEIKIKGLHRIEVRDNKGNVSEAVLEIRYRRIRVLPPEGKRKRYPDLQLTAIYAIERNKPKNREKIEWKLLTDLPISSKAEAIEKINWYTTRWKIEVFHKILKSGCKAESSKLRTASRIANLISVFCILSWRIFWMTMLNRASPSASPKLALTATEIKLLGHLVKSSNGDNPKKKNLSYYLIKLAKLGGYLARASDSPSGNAVMWRGLARLVDIELGFNLAMKIVGN